jgi:hypothetical protein
MDNKPSFDRSLLIPIVLGVFSCIGVLLVFLIVRLETTQEVAPVPNTETPFKFLLLATETRPSPTEPATRTPKKVVPEELSIQMPNSTESGNIPGTLDMTSSQPAGSPPSRTPTAAINPLIDLTRLIKVGQHDDVHEDIVYDDGWIAQPNVILAYQETLHVSSVIGSELRITFEGRGFELGYQPGNNSGTILVEIDGEQFQIVQAVGNIWLSPEFPLGVHAIRIVHESGGPVNLDYITILGQG